MPSDANLTAIAAERRQYFTPRWFRDLLLARLSLGDTFWAGSYGVVLIFIPFGLFLAIAMQWFLSPAQHQVVLRSWISLQVLYYVVLSVAVFRTALRTPQVGGWRWVGVFIALMNAGAIGAYTWLFWSSAGLPLGSLLR